jgi:hypothetical protein
VRLFTLGVRMLSVFEAISVLLPVVLDDGATLVQ